MLSGVRRIETESGCARVVTLASGGGFLQMTPIDQPIVENDDDGGRLSALGRFLTPVMGTPPAPRGRPDRDDPGTTRHVS